MLTDDLELDHELMVVLGRVALFGVELGLLGQFPKRNSAASQRLRELLAQQHLVFALRQQRNGIVPASALRAFYLRYRYNESTRPLARNTLYGAGCLLQAHIVCINCCRERCGF